MTPAAPSPELHRPRYPAGRSSNNRLDAERLAKLASSLLRCAPATQAGTRVAARARRASRLARLDRPSDRALPGASPPAVRGAVAAVVDRPAACRGHRVGVLAAGRAALAGRAAGDRRRDRTGGRRGRGSEHPGRDRAPPVLDLGLGQARGGAARAVDRRLAAGDLPRRPGPRDPALLRGLVPAARTGGPAAGL